MADPRIPLLTNPDEAAAAVLPGSFGAALESTATMNADGSAVVELGDEEDLEVVENDDGSATVHDEKAEGHHDPHDERDFMHNLVETLPPEVTTRVARILLDDIRRDKESREERDKLYADGIKRTGMGNEAPGGADFEGASRVVHPMIMEACVDFAARTMKEVFPARGPVKTHIVGKSTRAKIERAERKKKYMNWQCTKQIRELRPMFEQMLTQVPLGGSQYIKVWYDDRVERPRAEFLPVDKFHLPFAAADMWSAERKTHEQTITRAEFEGRVNSGLYADVVVGSDSGSSPETTLAEQASNKVEGKEDSGYNEDGLRTVYEVYVHLEVTEDRRSKKECHCPYIVTIDDSSGKMLAMYRNWREREENFQELQWVVEAKFLPWRGAYGVGLLHIAGSLSVGATGALRALLDSAHINNFPGALKLKGARMAGQNVSSSPTEITEIEGPTNIDDIRKIVMPYPFNGPSPVLFQLLEYMVTAGKGVIATADEKIADATANSPVGTTLAMIEQGSVTYSSVHARMHQTMAQILEIIHRIDADFMNDSETVEELGELVVRNADFQGPMDIIPVSDPNIFSETQRYAQLQAVLQLRAQFQPGSFKDSALLEQSLRLLNYPGYEDILNTPLEAEERTAVVENAEAGNPQAQLKPYDTQDHLEHLKAHVTFMMSPIFCANPMMAPVRLPKLMEHCKEHLIEYYQENVRAAAIALSTKADLFKLKGTDALLAAAVGAADKQMATELAPIMEQLAKLQQMMPQLIPPPPSPDQAKAQAEVQKEQIRQQGASQRDAARLQAEQASEAQQLQAEQIARKEELQADMMTEAQRIQAAREADARKAQVTAMTSQQKIEADADRSERELQAAAARQTEEMAMAANNARMAEQSEQRKQDLEMIREQMRQELQEVIASQNRASQDRIEAERAANQRYIAELNANNAQVVTLLGQLLGAKSPAGAGAKEDKKPEPEPTPKEVTNAANDVLLATLEQLLRAQSAPRSYAIRRGPDGSLALESTPQQ